MGAFFFHVLRGTFKVHSPNKRKRNKVRREQPTTWSPLRFDDIFGHHINRSWPHVVGLTAFEAEKTIKQDYPGVDCEVVYVGQRVTLDWCSARVRMFVDEYDRVVQTPYVG
ncbi:hypothetical protein BS78_03G337100 [Paspalum vaginatum]|nr:hypothetical protein BS78_03G337100 [Paspalum vaginatum]